MRWRWGGAEVIGVQTRALREMAAVGFTNPSVCLALLPIDQQTGAYTYQLTLSGYHGPQSRLWTVSQRIGEEELLAFQGSGAGDLLDIRLAQVLAPMLAQMDRERYLRSEAAAQRKGG